jgi:hypothetical protein
VIGLAAERLAERSEVSVPCATLSARLAFLDADATTLDPAAIAAVAAELGGLTADEERELTRAWLYYLARKEEQH